jgi:hypothetical protein
MTIKWKQASIADQLYGLYSAVLTFGGPDLLISNSLIADSPSTNLGAEADQQSAISNPHQEIQEIRKDLDPHLWSMLQGWKAKRKGGTRRILHLPRSRQGDQGPQPHREPQSPEDPESGAAEVPQLGRQGALGHAGEHARLLPLHRGHLSLQAPRRGPRADVRRRGRTGAHQQALPLREPGPARQAPQHRVRQRHALRPRSRSSSGHLRQGGQQRREHLLPRRCQEALQRLRPHSADHQREHDHQRSRADAVGLLHERRHRPELREVHPRNGLEAEVEKKIAERGEGCKGEWRMVNGEWRERLFPFTNSHSPFTYPPSIQRRDPGRQRRSRPPPPRHNR